MVETTSSPIASRANFLISLIALGAFFLNVLPDYRIGRGKEEYMHELQQYKMQLCHKQLDIFFRFDLFSKEFIKKRSIGY